MEYFCDKNKTELYTSATKALEVRAEGGGAIVYVCVCVCVCMEMETIHCIYDMTSSHHE